MLTGISRFVPDGPTLYTHRGIPALYFSLARPIQVGLTGNMTGLLQRRNSKQYITTSGQFCSIILKRGTHARTVPDYPGCTSSPCHGAREELGAKILFLLRKRSDNVIRSQPSFLCSNLLRELWPQNRLPGQQSPYPWALQDEIDLALAEAWACW